MPSLSLAHRPAARAVALFEALNLAMVLLFAVVQTVLGPQGGTPAWPRLAALVLGGLAWYALLLTMLRPGHRSPVELTVLAAGGAVVLWALSHYLFAFLSLALLPIAARYWLSLKHTAALAAGLVAWSAVWTALNRGGQAPTVLGAALILGLAFLALSAVFGAYTLLSFEWAVREARAREALVGDLRRRERMRSLELENASLAERNRIAQDLHDTLGHQLTAQGFDLQVIERLASAAALDARLAAAVGRARDRNAAAIEDLRHAVHALKPRRPADDDAPRPALAKAIRELLPAEGFDARLQVHGVERSLPRPHYDAVLRVAREALTNAMKHAPDTPLAITLSFGPRAVSLTAENAVTPGRGDGRAGDPADGRVDGAAGEGFGLKGLREAVEAAGGRFEAGRRGARFVVSCALAAEERAPAATPPAASPSPEGRA